MNDTEMWQLLKTHGPQTAAGMAKLLDLTYYATYNSMKRLFKNGNATRKGQTKSNGVGATKFHLYAATDKPPTIEPTPSQSPETNPRAARVAAMDPVLAQRWGLRT